MTSGTSGTQHESGKARLLVAVVAYHGVLADELEAFRDTLGLIPGAHVVIAGASRGTVTGPGGAHEVEVAFDELDRAEVVVVPGGLGAHRHPEISEWLRRIRPRFVVASSTGSALLAASGLLRGHVAVTHWLAGPLLEQHGVTVSSERLAVDGPYVTCSGLASTFDAAFVVARHFGGPSLIREIRQQLRERGGELPPRPAAADAKPPRRTTTRRRPRPTAPSAIVEVELEQHPPRR